MDPHTLIKAHEGIIYLFLGFFIFKTTLLFMNVEMLRKVRDKTKVVDMILGTLILASGIYLIVQRSGDSMYHPHWLEAKILLFLAAIPLGIVGMKKENKFLAGLSLLLLLAAYLLATQKPF